MNKIKFFFLKIAINLKVVLDRIASLISGNKVEYITTLPAPQNALDIFKGEWASKLPDTFSGLEAGRSPLFADPRMLWFAETFGSMEGKTILELGPLEGGHTYMLESFGAKSIVAIEANKRAYLKCLIIKELVGLSHAKFECGDFIEYLRAQGPSFDVCVASGVLYHMRNPAELIALIAERCTTLYLWTHYYDEEVIRKNPIFSVRFTRHTQTEYRGFPHILHRHEYYAGRNFAGFCGGNAQYSNWLSRDDLFSCLENFGFNRIRIGFDDRSTPHGPSISIIAERNNNSQPSLT